MPGLLATAGRYIAHNPLTVAGIGAGLGAAGNVAREALSGKSEKNYLGAGIQGAAVGGLAGAGVGGIGRAARDVQLLHPEISGAKDLAVGTAKHLGEGISNFAQRQVHGLTGYGSKDKAYLDRIGIAGHAEAGREARLMNLRAGDEMKSMWDRGMAQHTKQTAAGDTFGAAQTHLDLLKNQHQMETGLEKGVSAVHDAGSAGQRFQDLGMTSIPGAIKGMAQNPGEASKAIWNQLRAGGTAGAALGVGVPTAIAARDISRGDESAHGGRTVGQKVLSAGANMGGGLLFSGVPVVPQMVAGGLADNAANRLGRALAPASRTSVASPTT